MLTDTEIRKTKPTGKPVKLFDERGLYLVVSPAGGKLWRFDYRFGGKRKTLALGKYPDVGLAEARERRDEARKLLANDTDPGETRKMRRSEQKAEQQHCADTFEAIVREWFEKMRPRWAVSHADKVMTRLGNAANRPRGLRRPECKTPD